ncbi:MAG: hypothetical protein J7497_11680, partial [Chitinophagaceae bacterium]|nr:hypothetical protein [Chitinophagaceae bacterium]
IILHYTTKVFPADSITSENVSGKYVFTTPEGRNKIDALGLKYTPVKEFDDFHVTRITGKFINKKMRSAELQHKYLL